MAQEKIEGQIFNVRNAQVMTDYHLAALFEVETKRLNEQVRRNKDRFPENFMFQLNDSEWETLQSQFATAKRRTLPYVFTEQGVAMLSTVLNGKTAVKVSILIMEAFVRMHQTLLENSLISSRLDKMELKQLETDQKFEQVFKALDNKNKNLIQGIFFDGQIFDAYEWSSKVIKSAKKNIVLIDNYINEETLVHLSKKKKSVSVLLLTKRVSEQLRLDIKKPTSNMENLK